MLTGRPVWVTPGGARTVTLVIFVTLVVLEMFVVCLITIPGRTTGGALTTTAGGVPTGAGTMIPVREPGGGGTNTPFGPSGADPT